MFQFLDADFSVHVKMVVALSLVPIENLDTALEKLSNELPDCFQPLLDWFEDDYIGRTNRNQGVVE